jgi:hypothetical protein
MAYGDWFASRATRVKKALGVRVPLTLILPMYGLLAAGLLVRHNRDGAVCH